MQSQLKQKGFFVVFVPGDAGHRSGLWAVAGCHCGRKCVTWRVADRIGRRRRRIRIPCRGDCGRRSVPGRVIGGRWSCCCCCQPIVPWFDSRSECFRVRSWKRIRWDNGRRRHRKWIVFKVWSETFSRNACCLPVAGIGIAKIWKIFLGRQRLGWNVEANVTIADSAIVVHHRRRRRRHLWNFYQFFSRQCIFGEVTCCD